MDRGSFGAKVAKILPDLKVRKMKSPKRPLREEMTPSLDFTSKVIVINRCVVKHCV